MTGSKTREISYIALVTSRKPAVIDGVTCSVVPINDGGRKFLLELRLKGAKAIRCPETALDWVWGGDLERNDNFGFRIQFFDGAIGSGRIDVAITGTRQDGLGDERYDFSVRVSEVEKFLKW